MTRYSKYLIVIQFASTFNAYPFTKTPVPLPPAPQPREACTGRCPCRQGPGAKALYAWWVSVLVFEYLIVLPLQLSTGLVKTDSVEQISYRHSICQCLQCMPLQLDSGATTPGAPASGGLHWLLPLRTRPLCNSFICMAGVCVCVCV